VPLLGLFSRERVGFLAIWTNYLELIPLGLFDLQLDKQQNIFFISAFDLVVGFRGGHVKTGFASQDQVAQRLALHEPFGRHLDYPLHDYLGQPLFISD